MCGRFALRSSVEELVAALALTSVKIKAEEDARMPRFNIAPMQDIIAAREADDGNRELVMLRWGLVPSWAKDPGVGSRMINARAETAAEKPAYRAALRRRRVLLPASGFFEWGAPAAGRKLPFYFQMRDHKPFALAGLWERWDGGGGKMIESCTILTTEANELVAPVHERMPVVISPENYAEWLDRKMNESGRLTRLLRPYPAGRMESHPVGFSVNDPRRDSEELTAPVTNSQKLYLKKESIT